MIIISWSDHYIQKKINAELNNSSKKSSNDTEKTDINLSTVNRYFTSKK